MQNLTQRTGDMLIREVEMIRNTYILTPAMHAVMDQVIGEIRQGLIRSNCVETRALPTHVVRDINKGVTGYVRQVLDPIVDIGANPIIDSVHTTLIELFSQE